MFHSSLAEQPWSSPLASTAAYGSHQGDEQTQLLNRLLMLEYAAADFYAQFSQCLGQSIDASKRLNLHLYHARELVKMIALRRGLPESHSSSRSSTSRLFATVSAQLPQPIRSKLLDSSANSRERELLFRYHRASQAFPEPERSLLQELERDISQLLEG